jgi:hypothetical protein
MNSTFSQIGKFDVIPYWIIIFRLRQQIEAIEAQISSTLEPFFGIDEESQILQERLMDCGLS